MIQKRTLGVIFVRERNAENAAVGGLPTDVLVLPQLVPTAQVVIVFMTARAHFETLKLLASLKLGGRVVEQHEGSCAWMEKLSC